MRRHLLFAIAIIPHAVASVAIAQVPDSLPPGWARTGPPEAASAYIIRTDHQVKRSGTSSLRIQAGPSAPEFGAIRQSLVADDYRGRRIRLSGYAMSVAVQEQALLWMRIDGSAGGTPFDNMEDHPITGTQDWGRYELVLDVPEDATAIVFGALLVGPGMLWLDDFDLATVNPVEVNTTGTTLESEGTSPLRPGTPRSPKNLGFEPSP